MYCLENTETEQDVNVENTELDSGSNENNDANSADNLDFCPDCQDGKNEKNSKQENKDKNELIGDPDVISPEETASMATASATEISSLFDAKAYLNPTLESKNDYFDTSLFTGSFTYTYPIETVRGKGGLEPHISLTYSSSNGKGSHGPFGSGWSVNENYIIRDTRYTPENTSDDKYILMFDGSTHDLIYVEEDNSYHTETESFLKITKNITNTNSFGEYWIVKTTDGTTYRFGYRDNSEQINSESSRNYVSKWWMDLTEDVNGNQVLYNYVENPRSGEVGSTYLANITYNDQLSVIEFDFEDKTPTFDFYEYGNRIYEKSIVSSIKVLNDDIHLWSYYLEYDNKESKSILTSITKSGLNQSEFPSTVFEYDSAIGFGQSSLWTFPTSFHSYDGFGQAIEKVYEGENGWISQNTTYNELGLVESTEVPHYVNQSGLSVTYEYDPIGRPTVITNTDNTTLTYNYELENTSITNQNGVNKTLTSDIFGNIVKVYEFNEGEIYTTGYDYDVLNNLINITPGLNEPTTPPGVSFTYDSLGRKVATSDPDMGNWTYEYDLNGNLINQTDARGVSTRLTYDALNRVTAVDYPSDADVSFTYDLEYNGTLSRVMKGGISSNYDYDQRYRVESETITFGDLGYTTSYEYDSMDRVTSITYPDAASVNLTYNAQTLLESVEGVVDNLDYKARNQITTKELSNGVVTTYTYDTEKLLLDRIYTESLQDINYDFDNVGNILEIEDNVLNSVKNLRIRRPGQADQRRHGGQQCADVPAGFHL
ncbi:SpvB/TcaC N-terminal domain-containing protein [Methanolobus sp. WCC5]|uniref:SpvB/TcaC N-terminal domain-containing protein n=1 Tax=Methanolobus sp. WCC5 TaxID=3125785 RepID=UPI0032481F2A